MSILAMRPMRQDPLMVATPCVSIAVLWSSFQLGVMAFWPPRPDDTLAGGFFPSRWGTRLIGRLSSPQFLQQPANQTLALVQLVVQGRRCRAPELDMGFP